MRKIIYFLVFILGIIGTVSMLFLPLYQFDDEKIQSYNLEYIQNNYLQGKSNYEDFVIYYDFIYDHYNSMDKTNKEATNNLVKISKGFTKALMDGNKDTLYNLAGYKVISQVYYDQKGTECPLNSSSSEETKSAIEQTLIDDLGEEGYKEKKNAVLDNWIEEYHTACNNEEFKAALEKDGAVKVADELFLLYYGLNADLVSQTTKEIEEKGIDFFNIVSSVKNAVEIDKKVYTKVEYSSLGFIDHVKAMYKDADFYNPFPLLGLVFVYLIIIIGMFISIFKGLKGMNGKRRPKIFISSLIIGGLCFLLYKSNTLIPVAYVNTYHYREYQRLLEFFVYGNVGFGILIPLGAYAADVVLAIFGSFCKFGKKRKHSDEEDYD